MLIADTLSRAYIPCEPSHKDTFAKINAIKHLQIKEERLKELQKATEADDIMQTLKSVILKGWPESRQELPAQVTTCTTVSEMKSPLQMVLSSKESE